MLQQHFKHAWPCKNHRRVTITQKKWRQFFILQEWRESNNCCSNETANGLKLIHDDTFYSSAATHKVILPVFTKSTSYFSHARTYKKYAWKWKKNRVSSERARSMKSTNKRPIEVLIILRISGYFTHALLLAMMEWNGIWDRNKYQIN